MAPEQAMGSPDVDGRADLYALGCTLYEMLAGQPPFTAPTPQAVVARHRNDPVPPLTSLRPGVPDVVVRVIETMLAKSSADRYPSMARFAEALALADATRATPTPPPTGPETEAQKTTPNNLPRQRTHFIGRERELAECARLLADTRLLTLTGVGGSGKTRLALRLVERELAGYPDGVWFADLAPLLEPERVPLEVAKATGVQEAPGSTLTDSLARHLAPQRALVLLDNCEHLMTAVTDLADRLLAAGESLQLIATSREGLGIEGERLFAVRSLSVPAREAETDVGTVEASESAQLFLDRARAVDPGFALDPRTAPVVAEICRRLDGIPLAIELAAARVKLLSVEEIRDRLDDRFRLLTGGTRTALPRHQTLRATIEWSYDHLSGDEQRMLRTLAVFAGGWTLALATRVWGDDADEFEVLELLGRLVDKSLVLVDRLPDGATRYSMLETVRQYAREKLRDAGEGDAARDRHLDAVLALAEEVPLEEFGPRRTEWDTRFRREQENILAALEWCDRAKGGAEKGLRITGSALFTWESQGHFELGYRTAQEALERPGVDPTSSHFARVNYSAGIIAYRQGRYPEARSHLDTALEIYREADDRIGITRVLNWYGHVTDIEDPETRRIKVEALTLAREIGEPDVLSGAANALAELDRYEGRLEEARTLYEESVELSRNGVNPRSLAVNLGNLAAIDVAEGKLDAAREKLLEAGELIETGDMRRTGQVLLDLVSTLACAREEFPVAARLAGAGEGLLERMGGEREPVDEQYLRPWVDRTREQLGEVSFEAAFEEGRAMSYEDALAEVRGWLAA